jgi:hypothetical protein
MFYICTIIIIKKSKIMNAIDKIEIGDKLKLNFEGREMEFKVIGKNENEFKLFNKFVISFFADINFINENLVND